MLVESVRRAIETGQPARTFACIDSPRLRALASMREERLLGCRVPGVLCPLDHFVSSETAAELLARAAPGTLAAFEEAYEFDPMLVASWVEASHRGVDVLLAMPSAEQMRMLKAENYSSIELKMQCQVCSAAEATTFVVVPGKNATEVLCGECGEQAMRAARRTLLERLEKQAPYPGEKVLYQPIEFEECAAWRVLRPDSSRRADLLIEVMRAEGLLLDNGRRGSLTYLDVGCNTGYFCHRLAKAGAYVEGVDVVKEDIEVARLLDSYFRRDLAQYEISDAYTYLHETRKRTFDVTSAFSVFQWLMIQTSVERGIGCLERLFEKTLRVCFLEMGYAAEKQYEGQLPPDLDRDWVLRIMREKGGFDRIRVFDAKEHSLMRDLFVGFKATPRSRVASEGCEAASVSVAPPAKEGDGRRAEASRAEPSKTTQQVIAESSEFPDGHFHSPIVDITDLTARRGTIWPRVPHEILGIDWRDTSHQRVLGEFFPRWFGEWDYPETLDEAPSPGSFYTRNGQFSWLDARCLFVLLRQYRPRRLIEVGSGYSSLLIADVNRRFLGGATEFTCIEPRPKPFLRRGVEGITRVVEERVERLGTSLFTALEPGDILFIDSSHVAKTGSDVNFLVFDVLPRLRAGVLIHFHDVFLPFEYPQDWVLKRGRSWNEQYVVRALLMHSTAFRVVFACHYAQYRFTDLLRAALAHPRGMTYGGGSFWIERIAAETPHR